MWKRPALRGPACFSSGACCRITIGRRAAAEHGDRAVVAEQLEGHAVAVVADHAVEVADAQRHRAHAGVGGEAVRCRPGCHWL